MHVFALRFFKAFFEFVGWSSEYGAIVEFDLLVGKATREFSCIEPKLLSPKAAKQICLATLELSLGPL